MIRQSLDAGLIFILPRMAQKPAMRMKIILHTHLTRAPFTSKDEYIHLVFYIYVIYIEHHILHLSIFGR